MRNSLRLIAFGLLAALALPAGAQDKVVNVYNWSDYIDETVLEEFTKETGIKVVYDVYDSNEIVESKLLPGGSGYDIVVPTDSTMARLLKAGAIAKLDKSKLPNLSNMWPAINDRLAAYDPGNDHAVDYMWGTSGLGYNSAMVSERIPDAPTDSWSLLFDPQYAEKLQDCGIHILDSPEDVFQSALAYLGKNPDSKDPADIQAAGDLLKKVRPFVQKFHSSEYINALANGDICLALGYSGDIFQARDRALEADNGVEIGYIIPKEGALMWFDTFVIPSDAPHPEEAHAFINYMLKPDVAAKNSNYVYYANGNLASQSLLNEDVIGDPAIYPDEDTMGRLFTSTTYDQETQNLITRLWSEIKAGR
jgi:putrescine transport system substrate-binding protein